MRLLGRPLPEERGAALARVGAIVDEPRFHGHMSGRQNLWMLAAANAHLGRMVEAHRFLDDLKRVSPGVTIARIKSGQPAYDPSRLASILDGLRLAGLSDV